jgi:hypothetical protein
MTFFFESGAGRREDIPAYRKFDDQTGSKDGASRQAILIKLFSTYLLRPSALCLGVATTAEERAVQQSP